MQKNIAKNLILANQEFTKEKSYCIEKLAGELIKSSFPYDHSPWDTDIHEKEELTFQFADYITAHFSILKLPEVIKLVHLFDKKLLKELKDKIL